MDLFNTDNVVESLTAQYPRQKIYFIKTDVTNGDNVRQSFAEAAAKFTYIDVLIGNAGILDESKPEKTIQVNLVSQPADRTIILENVTMEYLNIYRSV